MSTELIKHLILDSLNLDDESINMILNEIKIDKSFKNRLVSPYQNTFISKNKIILAIKDLIKENLIDVYEVNKIKINKDVGIENLDFENTFLHITEYGTKWYKDKYYEFWLD